MRTHLHSLSHTTLMTAIALLTLPISWAHAQQLQMLPPTAAGTSTVCGGGNSLLFFSGSAATDPSTNKPVSAINCLPSNIASPSIDPASGNLTVPAATLLGGDLWVGSMVPGGNFWTGGTDPYGAPRLFISGYSGFNSDPMYFQRNDIAKDQAVLRLVLGDNWGAPFYPTPTAGAGGDAYQIGALDSGNGDLWHPLFTFTGDGKLGIGTTAPAVPLDIQMSSTTPVVAMRGDNNVDLMWFRNNSGIPGVWGYSWDLSNRGTLSSAADTLNLYKNGGANGLLDVVQSWQQNGNVGIGTSSPAGTLDIENSTGTANVCLNGTCVNTLVDMIDCRISTTPTPIGVNEFASHVYTFTADNCHGILPDAHYLGIMAATEVCGADESWQVVQPTASQTPGIAFWTMGGCGTTGPAASAANIEVVFFRNARGVNSNTSVAAPPSAPSLPSCAAGETLVSNGNSGWTCGGTAAGTTPGTPVYIRTASFVGATAWNVAVDNYITWCNSTGSTFCGTLGASCKLDTAGNDGSAGSVTAYSTTVNSVACQTIVCEGKTNIYPNLVYLNGTCAPGQTPANSGNLGCNTNGSPVIGYSCLDTQ